MISEDSAIPLANPCALWFPSATSQELWAALGRDGVLRAVLWLSKARGHGLTPRGWGQTGLGMLVAVSNTLWGEISVFVVGLAPLCK